MAKQVLQVYSFITGTKQDLFQVELDPEWFSNGKLPNILVFEDGMTAYKYLTGYCMEDGYFVSGSNIVKEAVPEVKYHVYTRKDENYEWQLDGTWKHSLDSAIKCERYYQRMHGLQTKREAV